MKFKHMSISDIHISTKKQPSDYLEELLGILDVIDNIYVQGDKINLLSINGDLFDKVYSANDPSIHLASTFIDELNKRSIAYGFVVLIIRGTLGHDNTQIEMFKPVFSNSFVYVDKPSIYDIDGVIVRAIPEYYSTSYKELYDQAFGSMCDITILHGLIENCAPFIKYEPDINSDIKVSQVIPIDDLLRYNKYYTVAGHIHNRIFIDDRIWYTGSYSSSSFSDANAKKGFDIITTDTETGEYEINFIENKLAKRYSIINGTEPCTRTVMKAKAFFNALRMDMDNNDIIRIDINCNNFSEDNMNTVNLMMSQFGKNFKFKIIRDIKQVTTAQNIIEEAEFVLSPNVTLVEKIHMIIQEEYNVDMSTQRLSELLELPN